MNTLDKLKALNKGEIAQTNELSHPKEEKTKQPLIVMGKRISPFFHYFLLTWFIVTLISIILIIYFTIYILQTYTPEINALLDLIDYAVQNKDKLMELVE